MERVELVAQDRSVQGKKVKQLRVQGWIPAVMYGPDIEPKTIQASERALVKAMQQAGTTSLIDLLVDGEAKPYLVLARDVQRDILTGRLQHVDFYQVRLTEKVRTSPRLEIVGESHLIESGKAVLVQIMNQVEVECLPTDLISSIPVDISALQTLEDSISISDLPIPEGVTVLADPSDTVASAVPPRIARELEELEELEVAEVVLEEEVEEVVVAEAQAEEEEEDAAED
jgi:large subunit ribosomal protein L25